ncbi:MAG: PD-(D/E)XK nuclease family protein [Myxococcales bacterium]|nr:PD-(D/E)XK nuclease family protein [Myxococcales bacterium]
MPPFKNSHLSFSLLSRFEQCPLSFRLHYVDEKQPSPSVAPRFGKAVHAVLKTLVREHMDEERGVPVRTARLRALEESLGGLRAVRAGGVRPGPVHPALLHPPTRVTSTTKTPWPSKHHKVRQRVGRRLT